ncbi:LysR substrate-binding domain-containing protein [Yinghuangia aomiensis]
MDEQMWLVLPAATVWRTAGHCRSPRSPRSAGSKAAARRGEPLARSSAMAGFTPRVVCTSTDYLFSQSLVDAGIGIALIPRIALATHKPGLAFIALDQPRPVRHIGVLTAERRRPQPLVAALLTALREAVAAIPADPRDESAG